MKPVPSVGFYRFAPPLDYGSFAGADVMLLA